MSILVLHARGCDHDFLLVSVLSSQADMMKGGEFVLKNPPMRGQLYLGRNIREGAQVFLGWVLIWLLVQLALHHQLLLLLRHRPQASPTLGPPAESTQLRECCLPSSICCASTAASVLAECWPRVLIA